MNDEEQLHEELKEEKPLDIGTFMENDLVQNDPPQVQIDTVDVETDSNIFYPTLRSKKKPRNKTK